VDDDWSRIGPHPALVGLLVIAEQHPVGLNRLDPAPRQSNSRHFEVDAELTDSDADRAHVAVVPRAVLYLLTSLRSSCISFKFCGRENRVSVSNDGPQGPVNTQRCHKRVCDNVRQKPALYLGGRCG
jgi:hypothetical protein